MLVNVEEQQLLVDDITVLFNKLASSCLTEDDQKYLADDYTQQVTSFQDLLKTWNVRMCKIINYVCLVSLY